MNVYWMFTFLGNLYLYKTFDEKYYVMSFIQSVELFFMNSNTEPIYNQRYI